MRIRKDEDEDEDEDKDEDYEQSCYHPRLLGGPDGVFAVKGERVSVDRPLTGGVRITDTAQPTILNEFLAEGPDSW